MRRTAACLLCFVWLATLGCANSLFDLSDKEGELKEAQRKYTELVRWGELQSASAYVDPTITGAFLDAAEAFQGIRFTDFESGPLQFSEDSETATVNVVYYAYSTRTLVEKQFREHQEWYREASANNSWRVRPNLDAIAKNLGGSR
jgi:shikimate kinase